MKRVSLLKTRPHTSKPRNSTADPFHPYKFLDKDQYDNKLDQLKTLPNPSHLFTKYYNSFNYDKTDLKTYTTILQNENNRGLRSDKHFERFVNAMIEIRTSAQDDVEEAKIMRKQIENPSLKTKKIKESPEKNKKEDKILNQKTFEKKMKNLSEKMSNKTTLTKINEVMKDLYDEKKRNKKIVKYMDSFKLGSKNLRDSKGFFPNSMRISQIRTKKSDSLSQSPTNILDSNQKNAVSATFIPKAVTMALDQLKNFIIDVPFIDDESLGGFNNRALNLNKEKDLQKDNFKSSFFRRPSKLMPGGQFNNEKHLKEDFKMFKGKKGNKLIRRFTDVANEDAHKIEMNYYLNLLRLKNVGVKTKNERNEVYDFNDELHKIYKKETLIRSHGRLYKRKFGQIKKEMNEIEQKRMIKKVDKLEVNIHKGLMKDYKLEERMAIRQLVEKMNPGFQHKNSL